MKKEDSCTQNVFVSIYQNIPLYIRQLEISDYNVLLGNLLHLMSITSQKAISISGCYCNEDRGGNHGIDDFCDTYTLMYLRYKEMFKYILSKYTRVSHMFVKCDLN